MKQWIDLHHTKHKWKLWLATDWQLFLDFSYNYTTSISDSHRTLMFNGINGKPEVCTWTTVRVRQWPLTHGGREKNCLHFPWLQMHFVNKTYIFRLRFCWSLLLCFQLMIFQHWFKYWLGVVQATSHYLNQWRTSLVMWSQSLPQNSEARLFKDIWGQLHINVNQSSSVVVLLVDIHRNTST